MARWFAKSDFHAYCICAMALNKCGNPSYPMISVGSGIGRIERAIELEHKVGIICVDPNPESFNKRSEELKEDDYHMPDYALVTDLVKAKPELIGKCSLLLIWPDPCDSVYDMEAVVLLRPVSIVVLYEPYGASGGRLFSYWTMTCESYCSEKAYNTYVESSEDYKIPVITNKKYVHCREQVVLKEDMFGDERRYTLALLWRVGTWRNKELYNGVIKKFHDLVEELW